MDKSTFERINTFCDDEKITQTERDTVFRKFLEIMFDSITQQEHQKGTPLTPKEIKHIEQTYLTDAYLSTLIGNAKQYHSTVEERLLQKFQKNNGKSNFWYTIWTGIVGNAIYSGLLIIAFILGKDLISSWLSSLLK